MKRLTALLLALFFLLPAGCTAPAAEGEAGEDPAPQTPPVTQPAGDGTPEEPESEPLPEQPEQPQIPEWIWQHDDPENCGLSASALQSLHSELDGTAVQACVIVRGGVIADEYYKDGYDAGTSFLLHSCSKSVTSALVGIAIDQGYIEGVDVPLSDYFPQVLESDNPYWQQITLWHLLTHTSGIRSSDDEVWEQWRASENWVDYVLSRPVTSQPGTVFSYSTGNTHLLAAILQIATGKTAYEYGKEVLFDPLGMDSVQCDTDPQGISDGGNGFSMNVYDMAKFGQLYLNGGTWQGEQIVSPEWVEASTTVQFTRSSGSADYGYQWWVRTFGQAEYPAFFAQGHFGQYIFVVPQLELIVVFTSHHTGSSSMYWQFMNDIVAACTP